MALTHVQHTPWRISLSHPASPDATMILARVWKLGENRKPGHFKKGTDLFSPTAGVGFRHTASN